jgi:hypothetical protein
LRMRLERDDTETRGLRGLGKDMQLSAVHTSSIEISLV